MTMRTATPEDAAAIAAIWNDVIRNSAATFNSQEKSIEDVATDIAAKHAAGHGFLVLEKAGAIQGFATYGQFRGGVGYRHTVEHTVYIHPEAKGRGYGRSLVQAIEDHAAKAGAHTIFAGVSAENAAGIGFHAALGYQEIARLPEVGFKFGRWMDLVLMQKHL